MHPKQKKTLKKKKQFNIKTEALKWLGETQFHGANRLAEGDASWFWIPSMLLLLVSCSLLVHFIIFRYQENPTFMVQQDAGNYQLAFPSVIICPEVNFRSYKKREFLSKIKLPPSLNASYVYNILPQLAVFFNADVLYNYHNLVELEYLLKYNNLEIEKAGKMLTSSCEETLIKCRWQNVYHKCSKLFKMELTRDGFCCVFNGRSLRREMRKTKKVYKEAPTLYTRRFGFSSGLMMAVNQTQRPWNIDLAYKWIALQGGQQFVDTSFNGTPLNPGTEQWFYYYVFGFHITDTARQLSADLRKCIFAEDKLKYFPFYRKKYCTLECEIANTMRWCRCVLLVHPRPQGVPYCDAKSLQCARQVRTSNCGCLPTCNVNTAITRTSSFQLHSSIVSTDHFYANLDFEKITVVRTFIQKRRTTVKQRWPYFTYLNLFSQLGGMFSVFFGCSILTILGVVQALWRLTVCLVIKLTINKPSKKKKSNYELTNKKHVKF